jgi:hypothetical protein
MKKYTDFNHKEFRKGYIVNDGFNKPTLFDTGKHIFKNTYNFYNQTKEGQIGVSKGLNTFNNSILITPNNPFRIDKIQEKSNTTTSSNWINDDIGNSLDNLKNLADFITKHDLIGGITWCGWDKVYPLTIEITGDFGKLLYYIAYGIIENGETITYEGGCLEGKYSYTIQIHRNIFQVGYIPYPTVDIDTDYWRPISAYYQQLRPTRGIKTTSASEKDIFCAPSSKRCLTVMFFQRGFMQHNDECNGGGIGTCLKALQNSSCWSSCWCDYMYYGYSIYYGTINYKLKIYWKRITLNYACNI